MAPVVKNNDHTTFPARTLVTPEPRAIEVISPLKAAPRFGRQEVKPAITAITSPLPMCFVFADDSGMAFMEEAFAQTIIPAIVSKAPPMIRAPFVWRKILGEKIMAG